MHHHTNIIRDYEPADIDFIISSQLELYKKEYGFDSDIWKNYLVNGVHQLINNFNPEKDCLKILELNGKAAGSIAIVHTNDSTAQLRFFFIEEHARGIGAGNRLIDSVLVFCREQNYHQIFLWTFSTLYAARHLYKKKGFTCTQTSENNDWGPLILEERWNIELTNPS